ncbi:MAG: helix-turn-helix domain-containing protein [Planctomycetia bacterium]|nr:helix-turn-helix domain-containing protein [Planctomycetia bacterium]
MPHSRAANRQLTVAVLLGGGDADRQAARGVIDYARDGRKAFSQAAAIGSLPGWVPATLPAWSILVDANPADLAAETASIDAIIGSPHDARFFQCTRHRHLPAVAIDDRLAAPSSTGLGVLADVRIDGGAVIRLAVAELVACGAVTLVFMPAADDQRLAEAFVRQARKARRTPLIAHSRDTALREPTGFREWLQDLPRPIGILAADDRQAAFVLDAVRRLRWRVSGDAFVVGIGNDDLLCEAAEPPITSVDLGYRQLGVVASAVLHAALNGRHDRCPRHVAVPPAGLVRRRSTAGLFTTDPQVSEAIRQLRNGLVNDVTPATLARSVGLSRAWLDERFRRTFGRTVHEEIVATKIGEVKRLLRDPTYPIAAVATACGFSSTQYMSTFFKRHVGMTPGQFRDRVDRGLKPAARQ